MLPQPFLQPNWIIHVYRVPVYELCQSVHVRLVRVQIPIRFFTTLKNFFMPYVLYDTSCLIFNYAINGKLKSSHAVVYLFENNKIFIFLINLKMFVYLLNNSLFCLMLVRFLPRYIQKLSNLCTCDNFV